MWLKKSTTNKTHKTNIHIEKKRKTGFSISWKNKFDFRLKPLLKEYLKSTTMTSKS